MKTIIIFNGFDEDLCYYVLEGNYIHLNHVYIGADEQEDLQIELMSILLDTVEWKYFPISVIEKNIGSVIVIEAGQFP